MGNKPDKLDMQQEIDNLKELYNTSFFDGDTMKKSSFDIFIAIDNIAISPDMKIGKIIQNNPISFKFVKDGKTIGLENAMVTLNDDIESFFVFTKRVLEDIKSKAPARIVPDNTAKNKDDGSKKDSNDTGDGEQSKDVEFRNNKYYYFPSNLENIYRMDNTIMKPSSYTSALIQHIKLIEDETK